MSDDESIKKTPTAVSTLFVGKIPRTANSRELEEFFSEIGPIRNCFVVADRTKGKIEESDPKFQNKGIGYVHFSVAEDAQQALEKLKDVKFKGQKIKMEFAQRKSTEKRTRQKASDLPGENIADVEDDGNAPAAKRQRTDTNRAARLIVRNLPWKYAEKDLEEIFGKHGQVDEVTLPRKFPGGPLRGFGFVQFHKVDDAEKAMAALNASMHHGRPIAVDWSLSKDKYKKIEQKSEATAEAVVEKEESENESNDDDSDEGESSDVSEEESHAEENSDEEDAVDSMEVDEENDSDAEENDDDDESEEEDNDAEIDPEEEALLEAEMSDDSEEEESDGEESNDNSDDAMDVDKKTSKGEHKKLPTASEGQTLFIRNLLFDSNEEGLKEMFTRWGPVVYARITRNRHTGVSRGTGFVCMKNRADADKCLEEFSTFKKNSVRDVDEDEDGTDLLMTNREKKKKGMVFDSILTPDAGSGVGLKFTLDGRVLEITRAVERTEASKLTEEKANLRRKEDKRNIYLMHEGVVFPGMPAAETMPPAELQKRQMAFATRKRLMSRDPSLFISKTRLSIRNLPTSVDDTALKKLGYSAIEKFKEQVKKNLRSDLTKEEKEEGWQYKARIKQGKIVRSKDRVDPSTSKLRSKGYGFLEYTTHSHALAALRYLNNNPDLFNGKRLIVEFSLENKDILNRRQERLSDKGRSHDTGDRERKPFNKRRQQGDQEKPTEDGNKDDERPRRGGGPMRGGRGGRGGFSRGESNRGGGGFSRGRGGFSRGDSSRGGSFSRGRGDSSRGGGFSRGRGDSSRGSGFSRGRGDSSRGSGFTRGRGDSSRGGGFSRGRGDSSRGSGFSRGRGDSSRGGGFSRGRGDSSRGGSFSRGRGDSSRGGGGFNRGRGGSSRGGGGFSRGGGGRGGFSRGRGGSSRGGDRGRGGRGRGSSRSE